jgi:TolB-like protein
MRKPQTESSMPDDQILRSWKEIADFLGCDVKTCARWEADCGLPIRRFDPNSKRSRVFADKAELQAWLADRKSQKSPGSPKKGVRVGKPYFIGAALLLLGAPMAWLGLKAVLFPAPSAPVIAVLPIQTVGLSVSDAYLAKQINSIIRSQLEFGGRVTVIPLPGLPQALKASSVPARWEGLPEPDFIFQTDLRPAENPTALSVSLRAARSGEIVWSHIYENAVPNLTACFRDIWSEVRQRISLGEDSAQIAGSGPRANGEAGLGAGGFLSGLNDCTSTPCGWLIKAMRPPTTWPSNSSVKSSPTIPDSPGPISGWPNASPTM